MAKRCRPIALSTVFLFLCLPAYLCIAAKNSYHPEDLYSINCGSSKNIFTLDGRNWTADNNPKVLFENQKNSSSSPSSVAADATTPTTTGEPYFSARLSYSPFTYSFPLNISGHKFIRLFFNPTSYQNFDPTKAYFSVKSGEYTLLKDFNASLYGETDADLGSDTFFREYVVYVPEGKNKMLNVTFIPSTSNNISDPFHYYAFINGIEVVSMPSYLYHTQPGKAGFRRVGSTIPYTLENNSALETTYRFNVGGTAFVPPDDTGMLRTWGGDDSSYVTSPSDVMSEFVEFTNLSYTFIPEYTAPSLLYRSLRHMGHNGTLNLMFNLTWELPVDPGFTYMLRLHFCELYWYIQQSGLEVFYIYVQDEMVEQAADILSWSDGVWGAPVIRNYSVTVPSGNGKTQNISLKMSPQKTSNYVDATLNGLELFKISDAQGNLAGPNPPTPQSTPQVSLPNMNKSNHKTRLATVVGAVSGVVLLFAVVVVAFFLIKTKKRNNYKEVYDGSKHKSEGSASLPTKLCRLFSIEEIRTATNNFDELFVVGSGGFGNVYKGYIDSGATPVAIKRLKPGSQQGAHEFLNEIEMLSQLRHLHLVSLIGYCYGSNEMILVYDFMARGTLSDHLYNNTNDPSLSWKERLKVCLGAARGLHYLHTGVKHMIIHRDVKSTNILLDEKWVAKVSDFGLSRVGPMGNSVTHVSTVVKGSVGYLDPEYYKRQRLTEKSDVYSFGVVLLEVLCARPPLLRNVEKQQVSLVDWARLCYNTGSLGKIVDPKLKGEIAFECLKKFGELAICCLHDDGTQRPSMNDVVGMLEFVLQLQENSVSKGFIDELVEGGGNYEDSDDVFSSNTSGIHVSKDSVSMTSTGDDGSKESSWLTTSDNVFSEIGDPKER